MAGRRFKTTYRVTTSGILPGHRPLPHARPRGRPPQLGGTAL